jgi:hypothetical protein
MTSTTRGRSLSTKGRRACSSRPSTSLVLDLSSSTGTTPGADRWGAAQGPGSTMCKPGSFSIRSAADKVMVIFLVERRGRGHVDRLRPTASRSWTACPPFVGGSGWQQYEFVGTKLTSSGNRRSAGEKRLFFHAGQEDGAVDAAAWAFFFVGDRCGCARPSKMLSTINGSIIIILPGMDTTTRDRNKVTKAWSEWEVPLANEAAPIYLTFCTTRVVPLCTCRFINHCAPVRQRGPTGSNSWDSFSHHGVWYLRRARSLVMAPKCAAERQVSVQGRPSRDR